MLLARAALARRLWMWYCLAAYAKAESMSKFIAAPAEPPGHWVAAAYATACPALDATELKRTRQALAANETLLRLFVQHTPAAVAMFDTEMRCLQASVSPLADRSAAWRAATSAELILPGNVSRIARLLEGSLSTTSGKPARLSSASATRSRARTAPWNGCNGKRAPGMNPTAASGD